MVAESDRHKTAFATHNMLLEWLRCPQGSKNAAVFWARLIRTIFQDADPRTTMCYQDDVHGHTDNFPELMKVQQSTYNTFREHHLTVKLAKVMLGYPRMKCLGHVITQHGRAPNPEKLKAILNLAPPTDQQGILRAIGLASYNGMYIPHLATIVAPLRELAVDGVDIPKVWRADYHGEAFAALKRALTTPPVLQLPDPSRPYRVHVDTAIQGQPGIGAVLLQQDSSQFLEWQSKGYAAHSAENPPGPDEFSSPEAYQEEMLKRYPSERGEVIWRPVAYFSKSLTDVERARFGATEAECKGMHDAIMNWSPYLQNGLKFEVVVDHLALIYLVTSPGQTANKRLINYAVNMQGFQFKVIYRKGKVHVDADSISRLLRYQDVTSCHIPLEELSPSSTYGEVTKEDILTMIRKLELMPPTASTQSKKENLEGALSLLNLDPRLLALAKRMSQDAEFMGLTKEELDAVYLEAQ